MNFDVFVVGAAAATVILRVCMPFTPLWTMKHPVCLCFVVVSFCDDSLAIINVAVQNKFAKLRLV